MTAPDDERTQAEDRPFGSAESTAFGQFVRTHRDAVVQVARAALGPGADSEAEDVAQEVLLRTFRRRDTLRSIDAMRAWLARSTVHAAISHRRGARWRRPHLQPQDRAAPAKDTETDRALRALVMGLPDHERVAVHLHYWMGYTSGEIAGLLGCAEASVRSRLLRARRRLHRALGSRNRDRLDRQGAEP